MNTAFDFKRERWTPYKMVEDRDCYRVSFLDENDVFPARAVLYLVPAEADQTFEWISARVQQFAFHMPAANELPI